MILRDVSQEHHVSTLDTLNTTLTERDEKDSNCFKLYHDQSGYPALLILVVTDIAFLEYYPAEGSPSLVSSGSIDDLDPDQTTTFYLDGDPEQVNNDSIVPFSLAVKAAQEFFVNGQLPSAVGWIQL